MKNQSHKKSLHNSPFIIHNATTLVPIYHLRGARHQLLDLEPEQIGWLTCLTLHREGDLSLLPLAWQINTPDEHHEQNPEQHPYPTIHTQALQETAVTLTLQQLQQDGWQINGQLTLTFTGRDAINNFQKTYQQYLWQTPIQKEEL